ncbi:MAG: universal stress protein [Acidobacteriota bacterium]|nr:MAG: universal stress protein [Acidobacteriota bacterium]
MKVLVAYDGSPSADQAIEDLPRSGIADAEALVISVAEHWLPEVGENGNSSVAGERSTNGLAEASTLAKHAAERIGTLFPDWKVDSKAVAGSPAREILTEAEQFKPDLVVVGSQGRTALGRLFLGSISQKVLSEAACSVRIGRTFEASPGKSVIVIAFDGSKGSYAAVDAVAKRHWEVPCEIHLVTACEELVPTAVGRFIPPIVDWVKEEAKTERETIRKLADEAFKTLEGAGCGVTLEVRNGNPKQVVIEEAARVGADCVFIGANSSAVKLGRFLIGSTSAAVAARADCPVEVVRR